VKSRGKSATPSFFCIKAEKKLQDENHRLQNLFASDSKRLVPKLATDQIELELQNAEMREALKELEASHTKYSELFDFAPIGYFTFDKNTRVREMNLTGATLLGIERRLLINSPFGAFIADAADRYTFHDHCREALEKQEPRTCELRLKRKDGTVFFAQLQSAPTEGLKSGIVGVRTMVSDISDYRYSMEKLTHAMAELARYNTELSKFAYITSRALQRTPRINVSANRQGNEWVFSTRNNGIGIGPEYFGRILLIFQRSHDRGKDSGTGIDLATCKEVAERHGGRMSVESELVTGSSFNCTMPIHTSHES